VCDDLSKRIYLHLAGSDLDTFGGVLLKNAENRFCNSNRSIDCCEKEQTLNSKECSELAGTLTSPTKILEDRRLADVQAVGITKAERRLMAL